MFKVSLFTLCTLPARYGMGLSTVFRVQNSPRPRGLTCRYGVTCMVYETKHYVVTVKRLVTVVMWRIECSSGYSVRGTAGHLTRGCNGAKSCLRVQAVTG